MPLNIADSVANAFAGGNMPKKRTHRGRKPSTNPLNQHHAAFNKAHAAGNHDEARRHALNYANASAKAMTRANATAMEPDVDDAGGMPDGDADEMSTSATKATPKSAMPSQSLARLALAKRKK